MKKSEAALARAVKLAPNMAQVFLAKSHYYSDVEGDELLACNEIEKANNAKPNDHNILVHLAERLSKKNDYKNALAVCEQICRLDPKSPSGPYYASGNALALGRNDEALRWADLTIANDPDSGPGYASKMEVLLHGFGDIDRADNVLLEAKKFITREKAGLLEPEFRVYLYRRDFSRALLPLLAIHAQPFYLERAMLLKRMKRVVEAKRNFDSARVVFANLSGIKPNDRSIYVSIAVAWAGLGEKTEALQALAKVDSVTQNKNSLNIGYCYMLLGDHEGALRYLEKYSSASKRTTAFRLRLNPFWDPLRKNPGFARITAMAENR